MKQLFLTFVILIIAIAINANAQHKSLASSKEFKYDAAGSAMNAADVNARALKDFSKAFKNVTDAKWYAVEDGFFASFNDNGIQTKVAYDKKGIWHCTVRALDETQLPSEIRDIVRSRYYDFKILISYEIKHSETLAYITKMEDSKTLKTLRIVDGEIEIISDNIIE